ncbi:MAG: 30S ribosomal protein S5 [Candidatus Omnitrophica bacterium]|nr:30S ribosomal protein S5 [Candidatus Omnitrophota bacterium]
MERVIQLNRVSKVTKGGKNFSFNAVVVCGDGKGNVGVGIGKANEVSDAIIKGASRAKKNYVRVMVVNNTIPHEVIGKFKASNVFLKPAGAGTGVIAGASVRALCDAAGIKNILTKCLGSRTPLNILMATLNGFGQLRTTRRG